MTNAIEQIKHTHTKEWLLLRQQQTRRCKLRYTPDCVFVKKVIDYLNQLDLSDYLFLRQMYLIPIKKRVNFKGNRFTTAYKEVGYFGKSTKPIMDICDKYHRVGINL
jgi:hypothetical protein